MAAPILQKSFWASWRWWLPAAVISLILILLFVDPFIGDWDGLDYTILSLHGQPSSMAFGRSLFTLYNHGLYRLAHTFFQLPPSEAYLLFKYAVVVQGPLAVVMCWVLARDLSKSVQTATIAALLLTCSPVFIIYSGQVMTDVPAVLLLCVSLVIHYRGLQRRNVWLVLAGAGLLGLGVNLRETTAFFAPWLVLAPFVCGWKFNRRDMLIVAASCLLFLLLGVGGFGYWFLSDPDYRKGWYGWRESMRQESALHPVSIRNLPPFLAYLFVTTPLALLTLPFAIRKEWQERRMSPLLLLALVGILADLLLLLNYSTVIVWRYPLASVPALAPLSANYLIRTLTKRFHSVKLAMAACVIAIAALVILFGVYIRPVSRQFIEWRALSKHYDSQLAKLPRDAVVMAGQQTVAVTYWRGVGEGEWDTIGTGGGWPGAQLAPLISLYLADGRRVFLDSDPRWWFVCGWQREEIPAVAKLEQQFHFKRVSEFIYEVRPLTDATARDEPNLKRLLPENRPADVALCPLGRR
ncbi:MAG TPA: glycosyltransferase family 39 protein [Pyrinomonadaceae bacterium]|nr:glycosyltransferase family 39 protein [Pyrinomonadaceae bacterium]